MANNSLSRAMGRISSAFKAPSRREIETEYLNRSVSMYDLERRMKDIQSGKFSGF